LVNNLYHYVSIVIFTTIIYFNILNIQCHFNIGYIQKDYRCYVLQCRIDYINMCQKVLYIRRNSKYITVSQTQDTLQLANSITDEGLIHIKYPITI